MASGWGHQLPPLMTVALPSRALLHPPPPISSSHGSIRQRTPGSIVEAMTDAHVESFATERRPRRSSSVYSQAPVSPLTPVMTSSDQPSIRTSEGYSILAPVAYDPQSRLEQPYSEHQDIAHPIARAHECRAVPTPLELGDYPSMMPLREAYRMMRLDSNILLPEERTALTNQMRAAKLSPSTANLMDPPETPRKKRESDSAIFNSTSHSDKALKMLDASPSSRYSGRASPNKASPSAALPSTSKKKRESETIRLARMYHEALKEQSEASIKRVLEHPRYQQEPLPLPARRGMAPRPLFSETDVQVRHPTPRHQLSPNPPKDTSRMVPGRLANNPKSILEQDILADTADEYWKDTFKESPRPTETRQDRPKSTSFASDEGQISPTSSTKHNKPMRRSEGLTPLATQFGELSPLLRPLDSPGMVFNASGGGFDQRLNSSSNIRSKEMREAAVELKDKISGLGKLAADKVNLSLYKERKRQKEWELVKHEIKNRIRVIPNYD